MISIKGNYVKPQKNPNDYTKGVHKVWDMNDLHNIPTTARTIEVMRVFKFYPSFTSRGNIMRVRIMAYQYPERAERLRRVAKKIADHLDIPYGNTERKDLLTQILES